MRAIAILLVFCVLGLAVLFLFHYRSEFLSPTQPQYRSSARVHRHQTSTPPDSSPRQAATNDAGPAATPGEGFYLGKGGERVYINYGTPDPVLRSLLRSVMERSSDPHAQGREIYGKICGACHQKDGEGKEGIAPPLVGSEWILAPRSGRLVRLVLNGITGPIQVRGKDWNLPMPPWRQNLDDAQVAAVLTYIRAELGGNHAAPITPETVASIRKEPGLAPETADSLLRISDP